MRWSTKQETNCAEIEKGGKSCEEKVLQIIYGFNQSNPFLSCCTIIADSNPTDLVVAQTIAGTGDATGAREEAVVGKPGAVGFGHLQDTPIAADSTSVPRAHRDTSALGRHSIAVAGGTSAVAHTGCASRGYRRGRGHIRAERALFAPRRGTARISGSGRFLGF